MSMGYTPNDQINSLEKGDLVMVCEPIRAVDFAGGGFLDLTVGQTLRVTLAGTWLYVEGLIDRRLRSFVITPENFYGLEVVPK